VSTILELIADLEALQKQQLGYAQQIISPASARESFEKAARTCEQAIMELRNLELARAAISHVLNAIAYDPRKYWLLGVGTESYAKLTTAGAALFDQPLEKVRESCRPDPTDYQAYLDQRKEEERLIEIGREHDTEGGAS
jgi:hypothetical protein